MRGESLRKPLYPVAILGLLLFSLTAHLYLRGWREAADTNTCKSVYMYPSYARIKSFDESHTKFASKYSLYLYREQGKDKTPATLGQGFDSLDGIPALFIPGNAGSYRQVRSIAAECSILYFDENINVVGNENTRNLDFFAADFNEDFTAFHGRTLLDQAEYLNEAVRFILSLYGTSENAPKSVLILAHSMGGIVARVMLTMPSYLPESINTIVTLASPHSAAPLTFDGDILKIYSATDRYWHDAFHSPKSAAFGKLDDVSVISITGGVTDTILPADYTTLGFLVPPSNGLTMYTTGIPAVWTPMDHLEVVWCRQLRRSISKALLEVVDFSSPTQTYPLKKRMSAFKRSLLSGFEEPARQDSVARQSRNQAQSLVELKFDIQDAVIQNGANEIWKSSGNQGFDDSSSSPKGVAFNILPLTHASTVSILTDLVTQPVKSLDDIKQTPFAAFLCKKSIGGGETVLDFTHATTKEFLDLACIDISPDFNQIPRSSKDVKRLDTSGFDGELSPFWAIHYTSEDVEEFETLLIVHNSDKAKEQSGFMVAQTSESIISEVVVPGDMFSLITRGADISLLANRPLAVNFNIPGAWSSILAYKVMLKESSGSLFEPFIRQWVEDPYETKWIINRRGKSRFSVNMHGVAPFTPFRMEKPKQGLNLQFWSDPQGGWSDENVTAVELVISVDWLNSLKLLVMRYRIAVVSHCLAVTVLVMLFQWQKHASSGKFPDYTFGLARVASPQILIPITLLLLILTPVTKSRVIQQLLNIIDPVVLQDPNEMNLSLHNEFRLNAFYLGLEESWLSFIGPVFLIMAVGINFLVYHVFTNLGLLINGLLVLCGRVRAYLPERLNQKTQPGSSYKSIEKKVFASAFLLLLIPFYLPYQFAYVISFAIQTITCIKLLPTKTSRSCWNFNMSILMMMVWVLPINIPVLIVFVHNLNVSWVTPFSSHHNFLAVAPILIMVELCSYYGNSLPLGGDANEKTQEGWISKVSLATLGYLVLYSVIYGTRHTYWLHHLFNFWSCCICLMVFNFAYGANSEKVH